MLKFCILIIMGLGLDLWANGLLTPYIPKKDNIQKQQRQVEQREGKVRAYGRGLSWPQRLGLRLNLSDEQFARLDDLYKAHQKELTPIRAKYLRAKDELDQMMKAENIDQEYDTELVSKHSELVDIGRELSRRRFQLRLEVRKILDSEQRKAFGFSRRGFARD